MKRGARTFYELTPKWAAIELDWRSKATLVELVFDLLVQIHGADAVTITELQAAIDPVERVRNEAMARRRRERGAP